MFRHRRNLYLVLAAFFFFSYQLVCAEAKGGGRGGGGGGRGGGGGGRGRGGTRVDHVEIARTDCCILFAGGGTYVYSSGGG